MKRAMIYAAVLAMLASHATAEPEWNGGPPLCFEMSVHEVFAGSLGWDATTASGAVIVPLTYEDSSKIYSPSTEPGALITATVNKAIWQWNGGQGTDTLFDLSFALSTFSNVDAAAEWNTFGIIVDSDCPPNGSSNNGGNSIAANTTEWRTAAGRTRLVVPDGECIAVFVFTEARSTVTTISTIGISFYMRQVSTPEKLCQ